MIIVEILIAVTLTLLLGISIHFLSITMIFIEYSLKRKILKLQTPNPFNRYFILKKKLSLFHFFPLFVWGVIFSFILHYYGLVFVPSAFYFTILIPNSLDRIVRNSLEERSVDDALSNFSIYNFYFFIFRSLRQKNQERIFKSTKLKNIINEEKFTLILIGIGILIVESIGGFNRIFAN